MAANECIYFYEDEVYRITKKGNLEFGMVLQNADVDTDEEESGSEEMEKVKNGHILVAWHPRGEENVVHEKKVGLSDRCLMPGDIVRRLVPGQDTQRGYCRAITMKATVQVVGTRQVIYNVASDELTPLEEFAPDIAVCMDAWVGIINSVTSDVELQFTDGSVCVLTDEEAAELDDPSGRRLTDSEFRVWFYPGQKLQGPMRTFEPARWLTCNKDTQALKEKRNRLVKVTVTRYRVTSLNVHWQCRAVTSEGSLDQPAYVITGDDLKRVRMLNVFEPCTLQLGDMNTYRLREDDLVMSLDEWKRLEKDTLKAGKRPTAAQPPAEMSAPVAGAAAAAPAASAGLPNGGEPLDDEMGSVSSYSSVGSAGKRTRRGPSLKTHIMKKRKLKRSRPCRHPVYETRSFSAGDTLVVETVKTVSWVTVVWQDGTVEEELPSISLHPSHHLDEHEFFPGDYVVEQKTEAGPSEYGVVQRVDHAGRTAQVNWYQIYIFGSQASPQILRRTEASVYDLSDHPDFRYRPGTVVISVSPQTRLPPPSPEQGSGDEATAPQPQDGRERDPEPQTNGPVPLPAAGSPAPPGCAHAGQVLDVLTSGEVKVWWADGSSSNCYPQDLFRVGEYDSDEGELWDNGDSAESTESAEWETQSEESMVAGDVGSDQEQLPDERLKPKLAAIIEKIRVAMTRLEEIFTLNSALQSPLIMKQLLEIHKNSRFLDKLMDTSFFGDTHFGGLVGQIRERSRAFAAQREFVPVLGSHLELVTLMSSYIPPEGAGMNECAQFCAKLKAQLLLAHEEVVRRYGISLSGGALDGASPAADDSGINGDARTDGEGGEDAELLSPDEVKVTPPTDAAGDAAGGAAEGHSQEFTTLPSVPDAHKFKVSLFQPVEPPAFMRAVRREIRILTRALPDGIIVKGFEERIDLYSVMITGPRRTPYEDGLFFFEVQLSQDYPRSPPIFHYISYCSDRLNPNLYEDGKVCVSLLGTWGGRGSEVWSSSSSLMQVLVSIQGLILASEPYYNEAGYEKQRGSQQGAENSRLYNEMVILKLVQSLTEILKNPPCVFVEEVGEHMRTRAHRLIARLRHWLEVSEAGGTPTTAEGKPAEFDRPDFPLLPASRGFGITLRKALKTFEQTLQEYGVRDGAAPQPPPPADAASS
ncbi:(E3-independent) E2 ubiquitin-conjugating enzyme-like [Pollicipes pollicipes]|uniref:(E3-independent) E2 ubiquitin-conjugating enzyme-like n=1 Tax=Pollicipes pollicipes TaxID=41117 RepID=UPI0018853BAF|nr:(E3-independent) E2 ubiquitin-conjugating enzyme-like [Pollicipes pollicipes]